MGTGRQPVSVEAEIGDVEAATIEFELTKGRTGPYLQDDGLHHGSSEQ